MKAIRNPFKYHPLSILFNYTDFLCYNTNKKERIISWNSHQYTLIATNNRSRNNIALISMNRTLIFLKTLWWIHAKIKSWDAINKDITQDNKSILRNYLLLGQNFHNFYIWLTKIKNVISNAQPLKLQVFNYLKHKAVTLFYKLKSFCVRTLRDRTYVILPELGQKKAYTFYQFENTTSSQYDNNEIDISKLRSNN